MASHLGGAVSCSGFTSGKQNCEEGHKDEFLKPPVNLISFLLLNSTFCHCPPELLVFTIRESSSMLIKSYTADCNLFYGPIAMQRN